MRGRQVTTPGKDAGEIEVRVEGPKTKATPKITAHPDGTYDCSFTPTEPGEFTVHVTLDGLDIPESPFKATSCATLQHSATRCIMSQRVAKETAHLTLDRRRRCPLLSCCNAHAARHSRGGGLPCMAPIAGSQVTVQDTPKWASMCSASGPGLVKAQDGKPAKFTVKTPGGTRLHAVFIVLTSPLPPSCSINGSTPPAHAPPPPPPPAPRVSYAVGMLYTVRRSMHRQVTVQSLP
jgi:hypothetical protein